MITVKDLERIRHWCFRDGLTVSEIARDFRRIMDSGWYRRVFPHVRFFSERTENEVVTETDGERFTTSISGTLTGRSVDFIIIDDPTNAEDALSDSIRISNQE